MSRKSEIEKQIGCGKSVNEGLDRKTKSKTSWAKRLQAGPEKVGFDFQKTLALLKFSEAHSRAVVGKKNRPQECKG